MVDSAARLKVAARANVPPFHVMDLLAASNRRQETHGDLLNLVAGQPSTGAPQPVVAEAKRLLDADVLPKSIVCTASTAVDVLATLFSDEVAVTAVLPDQADVRPPARRNLAEMRRRFRDDHPHVEVVALRRADGTAASRREAAGCRSRHPAPEDAARLEATL